MSAKKKKLPTKKRVLVGIFRMGQENVALYANINQNTGGDFNLRPDEENIGQINIGIRERHWDDVLTALLHETFEYLACRARVRFHDSGKFSYDAANYHFFFDHSAFGDICARQSLFVACAYPKLHALWAKHRPKE